MTITVLTTGGTIDKDCDRTGALVVGPPAAGAMLTTARTDLDVRVEEVFAKDSLDVDDTDRALLLERVRGCGSDQVVITHGTDTMTETAEFLARGLASPDGAGPVVVLTGAMRPAALRDSDALFNLGAALTAVQTLPPGCYLCMSGRVFPAGTVVKDRARARFVDRA